MADIRFGINGWRAVYARDFTFFNCMVLSQCIATLASRNSSRQGLVVACDNRFMSEEFARECARVIAGNGIKTHLIRRPTTTAMAAFAVKHMEALGALMITAGNSSHEFCGIKFIASDSGMAPAEMTDAIELEARRVAESGRLYQLDLGEAEKLDLYREIELDRAYLDALKRLLKTEYFLDKSLKVVVDPLFGTGLPFIEKILQELGCEVKTIHNYRDPLFGGFYPDAGGENLNALQRAVLTQQAEIGLALDGDACGFGIIDKDGTYIKPHLVLAIIFQHLLQTRPARGPVARSMAATHLLDRIAKANGLQVIETPVGFRNLGQAMCEHHCLLAAEESGGMTISGHLPIEDGVLACLLAVESIAFSQTSLMEQILQIQQRYGPVANTRIDIPLEHGQWEYMYENLQGLNMKTLAGKKVTNCFFQQGVKIILADGSWALVKKSSNYDVLQVYIEGENRGQVEVLNDALWETLGLKDNIN